MNTASTLPCEEGEGEDWVNTVSTLPCEEGEGEDWVNTVSTLRIRCVRRGGRVRMGEYSQHAVV